MTKIWCEDYNDDTCVDASISDPKRFIGVPLSSGRSLKDRFPENVKVIIRSERPPTDFFMAGPMCVISTTLKKVLESVKVSAEFFPVELQLPSGNLVRSWFFFNPLESVECLDLQQSSFTSEDNFATNIERLFLYSIQSEPPLYRIAKTIPVIIAVRDDVAEQVQVQGCTGMIFRNPSEWTNPMYPT